MKCIYKAKHFCFADAKRKKGENSRNEYANVKETVLDLQGSMAKVLGNMK